MDLLAVVTVWNFTPISIYLFIYLNLPEEYDTLADTITVIASYAYYMATPITT